MFPFFCGDYYYLLNRNDTIMRKIVNRILETSSAQSVDIVNFHIFKIWINVISSIRKGIKIMSFKLKQMKSMSVVSPDLFVGQICSTFLHTYANYFDVVSIFKSFD